MSKSKKKKKQGRRQPPKRSRRSLHPRVMISGYYGFDNLGDELILRVLVDELKARDIKITVLSKNPAKTMETYGVDAIHRLSVIDIIDALTQTHLFISGGGGLFQDATGPISPLYYGGLIHLARFFEVPTCFWAQGVGPLRTPLARRLTASALEACEMINVRDEASARLVEKLTGIEPEVTADPVWMLKPPRTAEPGKTEAKAWRVGVSLRPWPDLTASQLQVLADCLKQLVADAVQPVEFLLLPFQQQEDTPLLQQLAALLETDKASCHWVKPDEVMAAIGRCNVLFGMRFHSLVLAILQDVAVYGLVYDPKVSALLERLQLQGTRVGELDTLDAQTIQDYFNAYPSINLKALKKQARRNFEILDHLLEIPEAELVL